ncbi:hypothetical protein CANARDRAFT_26973 [[Candida] arabinofermentans NRRL YB-2248]|uniref:Protein arginine N-methyltransferase n=1 Tax=[Candida] arabinofermentans NRRL YB-2248 TaxID=983967 RepID=A0A1E4T771_9ASCO|nr:hypothetical protein CANARDRAFT_26973 [[Candida] arabinofermentans NRRL YB-2248]
MNKNRESTDFKSFNANANANVNVNVNSTSISKQKKQEFDPFSTIRTPNVKIGIRPLPLTSALVKSDLALVESLTNIGYDYVLLPVTNARYRENCKQYFHEFKENYKRQQLYTTKEDNNMIDLNDLNVPFPKFNEVNILTGQHTRRTICLLSSWIELDTTDQLINGFSLQVIMNEISYANFVGIDTLLIAPPKDLNHLSVFTNNINSVLTQFPTMKLSISLPICEDMQINNVTGEDIPVIDTLSTWDMWNTIRVQCDYNENLSVSLGSPKHNIPQSVVNRWLSEPVKFYLVSSSRFVPNSKNYPVLNKFNQLIIWKFIQKNALDPPVLLLHGVDKDNELITKLRQTNLSDTSKQQLPTISDENGQDIKQDTRASNIMVDGKNVYLGDLAYLDYLRYLISSSEANNQLLPIENFTLNNLLASNLSQSQINSPESLQTPLQPLLNNLDNLTYKVFEQDSVKYECYERAMVSSLMDLIKLPRFQHVKSASTYGNAAFNTSALSLPDKKSVGYNPNVTSLDTLKIMIVGPGRGPLVEKLFSALKFLNLDLDKVKITAIEKNPNVMVYLTQRNKDYWNNKVDIINDDVRFWQPHSSDSNGFNLVISELLGSFGCNELSPECLDSIEKYCDGQNCIFIPKEYSSFVAPAFSPSIYKKLCNSRDSTKFHQMYIPMCDQFDTLSSKYAKLWTFKHPSKLKKLNQHSSEQQKNQYNGFTLNNHNKRQLQTVLKCHRKGTIHGLIGYFSAELYNGITISNKPTGSGPTPYNLVSWLPCFLPIDQPMHLTDDQEISIFIKRETNQGRVWYEWSLESFIYLVLPLENSISRGSNSVLSQTQTHQSQTSQMLTGTEDLRHNPHQHHHHRNTRGHNSMFSNELKQQLSEDSGMRGINGVFGSESGAGVGGAGYEDSYYGNTTAEDVGEEEYQVRVRTGVSKIHNPNGKFFSMKL